MGIMGDFMLLGAVGMAVIGIAAYMYLKGQNNGEACSGVAGECTYDRCLADDEFNHYCWRSTFTGLKDGQLQQIEGLTCVKNYPIHNESVEEGCNGARNMFCKNHSADGNCTSYICPEG